MPTELTAQSITHFRDRFGSLHDAVIHTVQLDLFSATAPYAIRLSLGAIDMRRPNEDRWVNLDLYVENVTTFHIQKEKNYLASVVSACEIGFYNQQVWFDFFPSKTGYSEPADYAATRLNEGAVLILVGKRCWWETSTYRERG